jgi:hypothetical protein
VVCAQCFMMGNSGGAGYEITAVSHVESQPNVMKSQ